MFKRLLSKKKERQHAEAPTTAETESGSRHFGSHAFDHPGAHARVVPSGVSSFDEVMHRLEEELKLAHFDIVSCASTPTSTSTLASSSASASASASASSFPVAPRGSGRAVTLTIFRSGGGGDGGGGGGGGNNNDDENENGNGDGDGAPPRHPPPSFVDLLSRRPGLCPLLPSVITVFEATSGGDVVVSAAAPAALPALLLEREKGRTKIGGDGGGDDGTQIVAALSSADAALRSALDSVFRLPKAASPPGTYAWPREKLPPVGGMFAEASQKARSQVKRMMS